MALTLQMTRIFILNLTLILATNLFCADFANGQAIELTIEFRDRTIIQIQTKDQEIPWRTITRDGIITKQSIQLSDVKRLVYATQPATERVAEVRGLLMQLGADRYKDREKAQSELIKHGAKYLELLKAYTPTEKEVSWRLKHVLKQLKHVSRSSASTEKQYDYLTTRNLHMSLDGDIGDWKLNIQYAGTKLSLDRELVREIHVEAPEVAYEEAGLPLSAVRSTKPPETVEGKIKDGFTRIDFDVDTAGNKTASKQIVDNLYISRGVKFKSKIKKGAKPTNVRVFHYNCGGRSEQRCAANASPSYNGTIVLTFCVPSKPAFPAGVRYVGLYASAVKPNGTALRAYNAYGQLIKEIKTTQGKTDYLAIESGELIQRVEIVPDPKVDPDYAIDDVYFDAPRPLLEGGDPDVHTVVLKTGERLQGAAVSFNGGKLQLNKLTFSPDPASSMKFSLEDIAAYTPSKSESQMERNLFVETKTGCVCQVKIENGKIISQRIKEHSFELKDLTNIWNSTDGRCALTEPIEIPESGAVVVDKNGKPVVLSDVTIGKKWLESDDLKKRPDLSFDFQSTPGIMLNNQKPKINVYGGVLRTMDGEVYRLSDNATDFAQFNEKEVTFTVLGKTLSVPYDQINSIRFPREVTN